MKKYYMIVGMLLTLSIIPNAWAITYTGSLTTVGGGIIATDGWNETTGSEFSWTVTSIGSQGGYILWQYDYTFTVPVKGISHYIIEVSPDTIDSDFSTGSLGDYSSTGPGKSNPGMPSPMRGLKFDTPEDDDVEYYRWEASFTTTRSPVWGDFYAKDGKVGNNQPWPQGLDVTAWNTGFTSIDPTDPPKNGSLNNHILRPDTGETVSIPEPGTLFLLGFGLIGLAELARKKFKK